MKDVLEKMPLLGVGVTRASEGEILEFIIRSLKKEGQKLSVVTINPEIIVGAVKNYHFKKVIDKASLALPDGVGVIWAAKILGKSLSKRITGVDFMEKLCQRAVKEGLTVGFLGGKDKVADRTAECLRERYPKLRIGFIGSEWSKDGFIQVGKYQVLSSKYYGEKKKALNTQYIIHNTKHIDILFVAFGFPKQELWIVDNLPKIPVKIAMGVGGAFDFISGNVPRAPKWLQSLNLEWLFRLLVQPWRWRRQLTLFTFIYMVAKEKMRLAFSERKEK